MTAKQELVAHLAEVGHGAFVSPRGTLKELQERHTRAHRGFHLTHDVHGKPVRIFLSPPKNPSASRNQDRNWVLNVSHQGHGWRWEMPGTWNGDVAGAKDAADKLLGYQANWVKSGWGFEHKEKKDA